MSSADSLALVRRSLLAAAALVAPIGGWAVAGAGPAAAGVPNAPARCAGYETRAAPQVCVARGDRRGQQILAIVKAAKTKYALNAIMFGVWQHGREVASGALGTSYPLVPATRDMHFRIGNITESMECTLLMQLVERGKLELSDPVSKWLPTLPHASQVTVGELARSTAGYASFYTDQWTKEFQADPFRAWTPQELTQFGVSQPLDFPPGTNWTFSDTNFLILGQLLAKAGGAPVPTQIQRMILDPLSLHNTSMTATSYIAPPVLHGYDSERGSYQDSTYWSMSWAINFGDMTSNLADMGRWASALGKATLLSPAARAQFFAPVTSTLGPFNRTTYYALGTLINDGWVLCNPNVPGYWDALGYNAKSGLAIVVISTPTAASPQNVHYSVAALTQLAKELTPSQPVTLPS
ncbi:MAG: serine hydrolase domain-containing protein [Acidimicrobiales bacterium]